MKKTIFALLTIIISFTVIQAGTGTIAAGSGAKITQVYSNQNGNTAFQLDKFSGQTYWIDASTAGAKQMLSELLLAWQNGFTVFAASYDPNYFGTNQNRIDDIWFK